MTELTEWKHRSMVMAQRNKIRRSWDLPQQAGS